MPENNVAEKYWLNNKQVIGSFGAFILLGIGYGEFRGMQSNDKIQNLEIKLLKEAMDQEENEMKTLIYTKAREGVERGTRMVEPMRNDIEQLKAWMYQEKGAKSVKK
jgi:hypothetical protein